MATLIDPSPIDSFVVDISDAGTSAPPHSEQQSQLLRIAEKQQPGVSEASNTAPHRGAVGGGDDAKPDEFALDIERPGGDPSIVESKEPQLVDGEASSSSYSIDIVAEPSNLIPIESQDVVPVTGTTVFTARPGISASQRVIVTATQDTAYASAGMSDDDAAGSTW